MSPTPTPISESHGSNGHASVLGSTGPASPSFDRHASLRCSVDPESSSSSSKFESSGMRRQSPRLYVGRARRTSAPVSVFDPGEVEYARDDNDDTQPYRPYAEDPLPDETMFEFRVGSPGLGSVQSPRGPRASSTSSIGSGSMNSTNLTEGSFHFPKRPSHFTPVSQYGSNNGSHSPCYSDWDRDRTRHSTPIQESIPIMSGMGLSGGPDFSSTYSDNGHISPMLSNSGDGFDDADTFVGSTASLGSESPSVSTGDGNSRGVGSYWYPSRTPPPVGSSKAREKTRKAHPH
ncbi:MAG: hypothetical protein M1837_006967 [Sclerophora amabilis]|nr:MAG: hypothetical protein M1837_006967 [Sclerophora amabilis]